MGNIKTLYIRNVLEDLLKKKKTVSIFIVICVVLFGALGLRQGGKTADLTDEQKQEVEEYNTKIEEYDNSIADTKRSIEEADKQIEELQEYVDNSIYMQIDPNNVQVVSSQYTVVTNNNVGNICNALIAYVNDGGLKEPLDAADEDLKIKYWRDIVGSYQSGNTITFYVFHHDMDQARRIMTILKKRVSEYLPNLQKTLGEFSLKELRTSEYTKGDTGVLNNQNNHRNNLKNYISNRADLNNKLVSFQNNKTNYIEKNQPENMEAASVNTKLVVLEYAILGVIFGVIIAFICVALKYILGDTLRSANDLKETNLNVLGTYCAMGKHTPALERSAMDVDILAKNNGSKGVFMNLLSDDELSKRTAEEYREVLKARNITVDIGSNVRESAEELKQMLECGACVLIAQAGKTTYKHLEQMEQLCGRFHVAVLGCIVIE